MMLSLNHLKSQQRSKSKNADLEYDLNRDENKSECDFENPLSEHSYKKSRSRPLSTDTKRSKKTKTKFHKN